MGLQCYGVLNQTSMTIRQRRIISRCSPSPGAGRRDRGGAEEGPHRVQEGQRSSAASIASDFAARRQSACGFGSRGLERGGGCHRFWSSAGDLTADVALQFADGPQGVTGNRVLRQSRSGIAGQLRVGQPPIRRWAGTLPAQRRRPQSPVERADDIRQTNWGRSTG